MDSQSLKDMTRRWILGIFEEGNFDLIGEMASEEWVFRLNELEPFRVDTFPDLVSMYRTAFPDINIVIDEQVVEGNVVVTRVTMRGTHQAALGEIPATGKKVIVPWVLFTRFEGDRIVEDREIWDEHSFLKQIGVIPESE